MGMGGGGAGKPSDETVEFSVQAEENLMLVGSSRSITRVNEGEQYPCLMMKTQKFSSLFRHYAKRHGLPADKLEFFFTERVRSDDTPEGVHLQRNDVIRVRERRTEHSDAVMLPPDAEFFRDMRSLLDSDAGGDNDGDTHADVTFVVRAGGARARG